MSPSQPIPSAGHGRDQRWLAELAAQPSDRYRYRVRKRVSPVIPHVFEELLGADDYAIRGTERFENSELLHAQCDGTAGSTYKVSSPVDHEVPPDNDRRSRRGPTTEG